jgi:hypothetical protein
MSYEDALNYWTEFRDDAKYLLSEVQKTNDVNFIKIYQDQVEACDKALGHMVTMETFAKTGGLKMIRYYIFCIHWLWENRTWQNSRQKWKAMDRDYKKYREAKA